jgi:hypothetical protein
MAQLTVEEKNKVSHRGKALRKLRRIILKALQRYDRLDLFDGSTK